MTASATTGRSADRSAKNQTRYFSVPLDLAARIDAAAKARGISPSVLLADFEALQNEWSEHNRKLGISYTEDEIVEMIREDRKRGRRRKRALQPLSPPVPPETPGIPG